MHPPYCPAPQDHLQDVDLGVCAFGGVDQGTDTTRGQVVDGFFDDAKMSGGINDIIQALRRYVANTGKGVFGCAVNDMGCAQFLGQIQAQGQGVQGNNGSGAA